MPVRVFEKDEKEILRIKMLDAGFPLIKEYGVIHTSVARIAKTAGIGTSTFYNFWQNKEEYLTDLIRYHRQKMLPVMISEDVLEHKRKMSRREVKKLFRSLVDEDVSIYPHMTLEDEFKLVKATEEFTPDLAKETAIATALISYIDNAREDIDYGLVANLTKLLAITAESKDELHASSYEATLDVIIEKILNLIIKEGF